MAMQSLHDVLSYLHLIPDDAQEKNLVMMALLRYYNISTVRVGGNTEFEGRGT